MANHSKRKYIHYGHDKFDLTKFQPVKNRGAGMTKPSGGFWASYPNTERNWKNWCEANDFHLDSFNKCFKFSLKDNSKVFRINRVDQLNKLPKCNSAFDTSLYYCVDFEMASKEYDAIEVDLTNEIFDDYLESLYFKLYGWDCDSILIMNPDIIIPEE